MCKLNISSFAGGSLTHSTVLCKLRGDRQADWQAMKTNKQFIYSTHRFVTMLILHFPQHGAFFSFFQNPATCWYTLTVKDKTKFKTNNNTATRHDEKWHDYKYF